MAPLVSCLSPAPALPQYTGPYKVGTVDVEIPVSELASPSAAPDGAADIGTLLFRVFYPAVPESRGKRPSWLPAPQRLHVAAYAQFLGLGPTLASILSFIPRHLHWTSIPAFKNATLLPLPSSDGLRSRWPTMIFSHGLGGNRNAYSHFAGSLASYGVVVICPEHRDSSAALTLVRDPKNQSTRHMVRCLRIPPEHTHEIWEARNRQLCIRLWELGLVFEALGAIDGGDERVIRSNLNQSTPESALVQFAQKLDVLEPGRVVFAGHSFGAATMVQFVKSTFYADEPSVRSMSHPLFTPSPTAAIRAQITSHTPTILLDMWCFPLLAASTAPLYNLPLPCYPNPKTDNNPPPPGGAALLAIESAVFLAWRDHLHAKARILSPDPSAPGAVPAELFSSSSSFSSFSSSSSDHHHHSHSQPPPPPPPFFFSVAGSAHPSQSDFGVLFPWVSRRVFGATAGEPVRALRLNVRAALQFLRRNGLAVAGTARADLVDGGAPLPPPPPPSPPSSCAARDDRGDDGDGNGDKEGGGDGDWVCHDDAAILEMAQTQTAGSAADGQGGGRVQAWQWVDTVGLGEEATPSELEMEMRKGEQGMERRAARAEEGEKEMQAEMEPSLETVAEGTAAQAAREAVGV